MQGVRTIRFAFAANSLRSNRAPSAWRRMDAPTVRRIVELGSALARPPHLARHLLNSSGSGKFRHVAAVSKKCSKICCLFAKSSTPRRPRYNRTTLRYAALAPSPPHAARLEGTKGNAMPPMKRPANPKKPATLSVAQLAGRWRVTHGAVRRMLGAQHLAFEEVRGRIRVPLDEVCRYEAASEAQATRSAGSSHVAVRSS